MPTHPMSRYSMIITSAFIAAIVLPVHSAGERPEFGLHASATIPTGGFNGELPGGIKYGDAGAGYGFGLEVTKNLTTPLAWTNSVNILFNPLEKGRDLPPKEADMGTWINIPCFSGIRLSRGNDKAIGYAQIQAGANFGSQTDTKYSALTFKSDWSTSLGMGLGAGVIVTRLHFGLRYYNIFESSNTITLTDGVDSEENKLSNVAPGIFQLLIGVNI